MRLAIVSDEVSHDLTTTLEVLHEVHCKEIELRGAGLEYVPDLDERWIAVIEKSMNAKRCKIASLAPSLFVAPGPHAQATERLLALAKRLKCTRVTVTAPPDDGDEDDPLEPIRTLAAAAAKENIELLLKTHEDSIAGTAEEALAILEELNAPNLALDWDVAACFAAGDGSGLTTLEDVLPKLKAVHVRDAVRKGLGADWAPLGKGVIPWEDILEQLYKGGFRGSVILEGRVAPKLRESRAALALLARWVDACRISRRDDEYER